jgi:hypothetical protein
MIHEKRKGFPAILESLDVGDKPASLNGEDKLFRCSFIPALKDLFLGEAIKGDVQLYRVKIFCVELQPLFLGEVRRIKSSIPPMGIVITTCTNVDHLIHIRFRIAPAYVGREFESPIWKLFGI